MSTFIPFVKHGLNAENYATVFDPTASCFFTEAFKWAICGGYFAFGRFLVQLPLRKKVRELYGISESDNCCGSDVCSVLLCPCCDLIQVSRQLKEPVPKLGL
jgi:Cys-rich protein (TIGR01571 family)